MASTISDVENILDEREISYFTNRNDTLVLPVRSGEELISVFVTVQEDGEFIMFRIPCFLSAATAANRGILFEKLLALNNKIKLGWFCLDPSDGEVCFRIGLPVEDGQCTARQLLRILSSLHNTVRLYRDEMRYLVATGIDREREAEICVRKLLEDDKNENDERPTNA